MSMPSTLDFTPTFSPSRAASATSAACSRAFVGMQPRCRQVPPTLSFSTITTVRPSSAARSAHAYPPLPAPRMTMSAVWVSGTAGLLIERDDAVRHILSPRAPHPLRRAGDHDTPMDVDKSGHQVSEVVVGWSGAERRQPLDEG